MSPFALLQKIHPRANLQRENFISDTCSFHLKRTLYQPFTDRLKNKRMHTRWRTSSSLTLQATSPSIETAEEEEAIVSLKKQPLALISPRHNSSSIWECVVRQKTKIAELSMQPHFEVSYYLLVWKSRVLVKTTAADHAFMASPFPQVHILFTAAKRIGWHYCNCKASVHHLN
jgi:hypothetical protein